MPTTAYGISKPAILVKPEPVVTLDTGTMAPSFDQGAAAHPAALQRFCGDLGFGLLCIALGEKGPYHNLNLVIEHDRQHDHAKARITGKQHLGHGQARSQALL